MHCVFYLHSGLIVRFHCKVYSAMSILYVPLRRLCYQCSVFAYRDGLPMFLAQNFVSRDRRMKLLSLRRSASVAVAELQSLHGVAEVVVTQRLRSSVSGDHINKAFCSSNSLQRSISRIPVTLHDFLSLDKENLKKGQTVGMPGEEEKCLDSRSRSLFASNSLAATTGIPAKDESLLG